MKKKGFVLLLGFIISHTANAQNRTEERVKHHNLENQNMAIQGYDPISYFTSSGPIEGEKQYAYKYKGVQYQFSSAKNKKIFIENPSKYEPAYGGWCAYAMGVDGTKVKIDPKTYKIVKGELNL